jgi:hypothetical protein
VATPVQSAGGRPKSNRSCGKCDSCKLYKKKWKKKVPPGKCEVAGFAGDGSSPVSTAAIKDTHHYEAASMNSAVTRNSLKRKRKTTVLGYGRANMGDQDWVDLCLAETKPSVPHQIGRRDVAYSKAWWDEYNRLQGMRETDLKRLLKQVDDTGSWGERRSSRLEKKPDLQIPDSPTSIISKADAAALYESEGIGNWEDVSTGAAPESHELNQRKRRQFIQLVYESMGCPPEVYTYIYIYNTSPTLLPS